MPVQPVRPKGPPLNALRAFEAAARLGSFAGAAEEMSVTPGAVSQHIRVVEDWAGVPLFVRRAQGVRLTEAGREVLMPLSVAFDHLGAAVRRLRELGPHPELALAALPSVAQLWLQPRLAAVRAAVPGVMLSVHAMEVPPDLRRNLFDLSLFLRVPGEAANEVVLARDVIFPVCAPVVADRVRKTGLAGETVLVDESWAADWDIWAEAGGQGPRTGGTARFSLYSLAIEEAKAGAGVVMGHGCLIGAELARGTLVRPFAEQCETGKTLVLESVGDDPAPALRQVIDVLRESA